ncbi:FUSC family protein [Lichenibacterium ramalinae]|uniref:FUSC family protein n=1 Tax=Lichenibacterium ramalinae TaxID=2316527 RepID=A0A4Q2RGW1_9HYPH|nr:FUSC family protein [Lichenibacterium ramalinae]RYB07203.1 FUSC family protein [Lichenibacterium ramalinae]
MSSPAAPARDADDAWPTWAAPALQRLLYGLRLAGAVSLALFIAFWLELDNPSWAGTSAAIVCQPVLGASLRKGFFRMIGTVVGATMSVVLTGIFPQNRVGFLVGMALWAAACSFGNTITRNFAAYGFALAGYTLAIIAGDSISQPGDVFHLAITRATEIIIGIACAMAVTGLSDLGRSRAALAGAVDALGREIHDRFADLLGNPAAHLDEGPDVRRALIARVAALDPVVDQAIGEEPEFRHRVGILREAVSGLFAALSGWRIAESHLVGLPEGAARAEARRVAERLPASWRSPSPAADAEVARIGLGPDPERGAELVADRREDVAAARALVERRDDGGTSQRLLSEAAAKLALGLAAAANGLALLREPAVARDPAATPDFVVADYLPAVVNAIRTFLAISAGILFWVATEWPSGLGAMTFLAVTVLLLAPQQEHAPRAALGFGIGTVLTAVLAGIVNFAVLPNHEGFLALALILSAVLVPLAMLSTVPALAPYLVAATMNFVPLVGPTNEISFNTLSFYNSALGIVGGCLAGALALVLIPPVPQGLRAERLVDLTLREMRRIAAGRATPTPAAWQHRVYARLIALPPGVDPVHGSRLVAALSIGLQVLELRRLADAGPSGDALRAALARLAVRDVDGMLAGLDGVEHGVLAATDGPPDLRIPTAIRVIRDVVLQHRHEFEEDDG